VGKIEFGFKLKGNFIEFYVSDTGIGIAPENQSIIFQRFRQVAKSNNEIYGGNGLGLSISKSLVEKLGGTLTVNSALGSGSTFTFTIPYIREEDTVSTTAIPSTSMDDRHWNDKTILIVEDEANNHFYMEEVLSDSHAVLRHAWNGKEAVEEVKEHPEISLVLMDIKMPVMDGYEATQLIKQIRPELPVIAQTAFALSHDKEHSLQAGFDNYIAKPISVDALLEVVGDYLK